MRSIIIGRWRLDLQTRSASDGATTRRLSPRATKLLETLADAGGEARSRRELLDTIWADMTVCDESLTQVVAEVRRLLGRQEDGTPLIETISKFGYRLTAHTEAADAHQVPVAPGMDGFDLEAYRLCLEARGAMCRGGEAAIIAPEELTADAVARAPDFALAHAEHAIALSYRWLYQRGADDGLRRAFDHAEAAIRLRPDQSAGYAAMVFLHGAVGNGEQTRSALAAGLSADPNDSRLYFLGSRALYALRDYRASTALSERAAELDRDDLRPLFLAARSAAVFDPARGRHNARACLARITARLALDPSEPRSLNALGPVYAMCGDAELAYAAIESYADWQRDPCLLYTSCALSALGDHDRALALFENVVDLGWRHLDWVLAEPDLTALADHRRFKKTARMIGLN